MLAECLKMAGRLDCIVVTGYGKSRQVWQTADVRAAALDLLRSLGLDAGIDSRSLNLQEAHVVTVVILMFNRYFQQGNQPFGSIWGQQIAALVCLTYPLLPSRGGVKPPT